MLRSRCRAVVVSLALAAAPLAAQPQVASLVKPAHVPALPIVARVNGAPIYDRDLRIQMQALFPFYSVHGGKIPDSAQAEIRQKSLDRLVLEELVYQSAKRAGIQPDPAVVNARIASARKKAGSAEQFRQTIANTYGSEREFRRYVERALVVEKYWDREVLRPSRPTEAALLSAYRKNKSSYTLPEAVRLQTISFQFTEKAGAAEREQARKRAEELLPQARAAKSPEAFGELAEKHSMDDWRVMNGDHGWVHRGALETAFEAAFRMKAGEVSGVVESSRGFHILRVNEYRAARQLPFAEARATIRQALQKERETQLRQQFERKLRQQAKVEMQ